MSSSRRFAGCVIASAITAFAGCGGEQAAPVAPVPQVSICDSKSYTPPESSPYRLPYAVGSTFLVVQGSCTPGTFFSHSDMFAYDFEMPIGTPFYAMRGGIVVTAIDAWGNDDHDANHQNQLVIIHDDGTIAVYGHLSPDSIVVEVNDTVVAGQLVAASGNNGRSTFPHLHVHVYADGLDLTKVNTVPVSFVNAGGVAAPSGELISGNAYTALPVP